MAVVGCFLDQEGLEVGVEAWPLLMVLGLVGRPVRCLEGVVVVVVVWWQLGEQKGLRMPFPHREGAGVGMAAAAHPAGGEGAAEA